MNDRPSEGVPREVPNVQGPYIIETDRRGLMAMKVSKGFDLWESDGDDDETIASHIVVDTAASDSRIEYEDIPKVIRFLERCYHKRYLQNERKLKACPHCKRVYEP